MADSDAGRERMAGIARKLRENTIRMEDRGSRILITGKGGVGKTTITALLAHLFAGRGYAVLAVDEDPQMNLAYAIGIPRETGDRIIPLARNLEYIEEKTGARPGGGWGQMLALNPDVSDVVERFGIKGPGGVNLLVMGTVERAAGGCLCPENTLLEAILRYIRLREGEVILMDTPAGVEHFGRTIAGAFDRALLVTDPTFNAVMVVGHAAQLCRDLGIPSVLLVVNRVRTGEDISRVQELLSGSRHLFSGEYYLPYDEHLIACEPDVRPVLAGTSQFAKKLGELIEEPAECAGR